MSELIVAGLELGSVIKVNRRRGKSERKRGWETSTKTEIVILDIG